MEKKVNFTIREAEYDGTNPALKKEKAGKNKGRRKFDLVKDVKCLKTGKRSQVKMKDQAIDAVNLAYKRKEKSWDEVYQLMTEIKSRFVKSNLLKSGVVVHNSKNRQLVKRYLEDEYEYRKGRIEESSFKSMVYDLNKSVSYVGANSLYTISSRELAKCLNHLSARKHNRALSRLRQLFNYIGRKDIKVTLKKENPHRVKYLSLDECNILINAIKKENKELYLATKIAVYGGLRLSEVFGLDEYSIINKKVLYINGQLRNGSKNTSLPKNGKTRKTYTIANIYKDIKTWISIPISKREEIRKNDHTSKLIRGYCEKLWPNDESKHLTFHDLRHCYAVCLASLGISTTWISMFMGNSTQVCEKHYRGFIACDHTFEVVDRIVNQTNGGSNAPSLS